MVQGIIAKPILWSNLLGNCGRSLQNNEKSWVTIGEAESNIFCKRTSLLRTPNVKLQLIWIGIVTESSKFRKSGGVDLNRTFFGRKPQVLANVFGNCDKMPKIGSYRYMVPRDGKILQVVLSIEKQNKSFSIRTSTSIMAVEGTLYIENWKLFFPWKSVQVVLLIEYH